MHACALEVCPQASVQGVVTMKRRLSAIVAFMFMAFLEAPGGWYSASAADLIRVGDGPFITGGGFFIAREKGYFQKMGITIETKRYIDGSMAVPSMIAGELDITNLPAAASLFNSIQKGAPLVVILDWGHNRSGRGYTVVNVTPELYDQGVHSVADFAKLKGKRIGRDPAKDVEWVVNIGQPDLMKMLGQKQLDATDLAYQFGFFAQQNKWGPIIATGDQIVPGGQIAAYVARRDFIEKNRDLVVR